MSAKLLTEHHLEFRSLKGSYTGWSKSTLVKMSNCWKSHALAHFIFVAATAQGNISKCQEDITFHICVY